MWPPFLCIKLLAMYSYLEADTQMMDSDEPMMTIGVMYQDSKQPSN